VRNDERGGKGDAWQHSFCARKREGLIKLATSFTDTRRKRKALREGGEMKKSEAPLKKREKNVSSNSPKRRYDRWKTEDGRSYDQLKRGGGEREEGEEGGGNNLRGQSVGIGKVKKKDR